MNNQTLEGFAIGEYQTGNKFMKNKKKAIGKPQTPENANAACQAKIPAVYKSRSSHESWGPPTSPVTRSLNERYEALAQFNSKVFLLRSIGTEPPPVGRYLVEGCEELFASHNPNTALSRYIIEVFKHITMDLRDTGHFKNGVVPGEFSLSLEDCDSVVPSLLSGADLIAEVENLVWKYSKDQEFQEMARL